MTRSSDVSRAFTRLVARGRWAASVVLGVLGLFAVTSPPAAGSSTSGEATVVEPTPTFASAGRTSPPAVRFWPRSTALRFTRMPTSLFAPLVLAYSNGSAVLGYADERTLDAVAREYDLDRIEYSADLRAALVRASPYELRRLAGAVGWDERLRYVEPVQDASLDRSRNDPLTYEIDPRIGLPHQWWFGAVGLDRALNLSTGSASILVGVIDSGVVEVADLHGKIAEVWFDRGVTGDGVDRSGHGTAVSSVIASNNDDGFGLAGTCGACRVVSVKVFSDSGLISSFASASAIRFVADRGIRVLNLSYGGTCTQVEFEALRYAIEQRGVLVVASSGNEGAGAVSCPAAILQPPGGGASVGLSVGASDHSGNRATFSNFGHNLSLVAPGTHDGNLGVIVAAHTGGYDYPNGTSFSAPMVAGAAALMLAARPDLNAAQVADALKRSASIGQWTPDRGWGVLNAARALELVTGRSSADPACADGVDNDGDGLIDYSADPGCTSPEDNDETNAATSPSDRRAPTVRALAGTYRPGARIRLAYRARDNSGETREVVTVYSASGRRLATIRTGFSEANGSEYYVVWRAPRDVRGRLRFCVRALDQSGNSSGWSCAVLRSGG